MDRRRGHNGDVASQEVIIVARQIPKSNVAVAEDDKEEELEVRIIGERKAFMGVSVDGVRIFAFQDPPSHAEQERRCTDVGEVLEEHVLDLS